ncbi:MAG TPA: transposase [Candidatus Acidoferrales bacterium]|nr:transposase [Candidatus Acidoferrales bacterium]
MTFYRRHLPHWEQPGQDLFITWRLFGSLPAQFRPPAKVETNGQQFVSFDRELDRARTGPLWLKEPPVAEVAFRELRDAHVERKLFRLRAYVLMANHIHILLEPLAPLSKITHQVKGATAYRANRVLSRIHQRFWQDESFDHWVRDAAEGQKIRRYIENNPVVAGLVARPEDWPWSSASRPIV